MIIISLFSLFYVPLEKIYFNIFFQGDIFTTLPDDILPYNFPNLKALILVSNTCDIQEENIAYLSFCPIFSFQIAISEILFQIGDPPLPLTSKNKIDQFVNKIEPILNYKKKGLFFLPSCEFLLEPCFVKIEQIFHIPLDPRLISLPKISLTSPWVEKLGFMVGNLYNRIATDTVPKNKIVELFKHSFLAQYHIF